MFAKLVNLWFWNQPPALAHRNRLDFLERRILQETVRAAQIKPVARIFNVGCGPAIELQRFLAEYEICNKTELTLLDFNEETLDHVRSVLEQIKAKHRRTTRIKFQKKSIQQLLRDSGKVTDLLDHQQFDLIYCAGLIDYLSSQICQRIIGILYHWLAPNGLLLLSNVDRSNPRRHTMEAVLEWNLIYRSTKEINDLLPSSISPDFMTIHTEISGVNIMIEIRKPTDG